MSHLILRRTTEPEYVHIFPSVYHKMASTNNVAEDVPRVELVLLVTILVVGVILHVCCRLVYYVQSWSMSAFLTETR